MDISRIVTLMRALTHLLPEASSGNLLLDKLVQHVACETGNYSDQLMFRDKQADSTSDISESSSQKTRDPNTEQSSTEVASSTSDSSTGAKQSILRGVTYINSTKDNAVKLVSDTSREGLHKSPTDVLAR